MDSSSPDASTYYIFYIFEDDQLTFARTSGSPIEAIQIRYRDDQTLETGDGMMVRPAILSFDSVRVTGFTLVRRPSGTGEVRSEP